MKFPKTRRDRPHQGDTNDFASPQPPEAEDGPDSAIFRRGNYGNNDAESHLSPASDNRSYPSPYVHTRGFDKESIPPLAANVESWSNLNSRVPSESARERTYTEEEDDVFLDDDDTMRNMRLGNYPYQQPGGFTEMAMIQARPEESHFGQGLQYYGPGYYVGASGLEIFYCIWNILTYVLDVGSDIYLSYMYFKDRHYWWFGLTLGFVLVPSIVVSIFSLVLYIRDWKLRGIRGTKCHWASRAMFIILQLAPLLRMLEVLIFGCRSRDQDKQILDRRREYDKMVDETTDSMLLRLFESFMEAAPQLVLQLYIITQIGTEEGVFLVVVQVFGLVTSMLSLASVLVSFQVSLRLSQLNKDKLRFPGMIIMFLWRLFTITARVIALALFASYFKYWVFVVVGVHWLAMLAWVLKMDTVYCLQDTTDDGDEEVSPPKADRCQEFCFRILAAFVQIFCFFNLLEGHTRLRCVVFYSVVYVENAVLILGWYIGASTKTETGWYHLPSLLIVLLGFWFGIFFQVTYYKCYHPNNYSVLHSRRRILWCVGSQYLSLTSEVQYVPEPTVSEINKSQLALNLQLNQTAPSYYPEKPAYGGPMYPDPEPRAPQYGAPVYPEQEPLRRTPRPMFQKSDSMSSRSTVSAAPGQRASRVVQKKWQPPERIAAGTEKLDSTFDSESTATTATGMSGSTPQSRAMKRARRAAKRAEQATNHSPQNQEPLPPGHPGNNNRVNAPRELYSPTPSEEPLPPTYHTPGRHDDNPGRYRLHDDDELPRGQHLQPVHETSQDDSFLKVTAI